MMTMSHPGVLRADDIRVNDQLFGVVVVTGT
jgi:hypothetical protein